MWTQTNVTEGRQAPGCFWSGGNILAPNSSSGLKQKSINNIKSLSAGVTQGTSANKAGTGRWTSIEIILVLEDPICWGS